MHIFVKSVGMHIFVTFVDRPMHIFIKFVGMHIFSRSLVHTVCTPLLLSLVCTSLVRSLQLVCTSLLNSLVLTPYAYCLIPQVPLDCHSGRFHRSHAASTY